MSENTIGRGSHTDGALLLEVVLVSHGVQMDLAPDTGDCGNCTHLNSSAGEEELVCGQLRGRRMHFYDGPVFSQLA